MSARSFISFLISSVFLATLERTVFLERRTSKLSVNRLESKNLLGFYLGDPEKAAF